VIAGTPIAGIVNATMTVRRKRVLVLMAVRVTAAAERQ